MNVKELREKANLTQQELAEKTGIPRDRIAKWEQGKGNPKGDDTTALVNFFREFIPNIDEGQEQVHKPYMATRREKKNHDSSPYMVPLVPVAAQAGYSKAFSNTDFINKLDS